MRKKLGIEAKFVQGDLFENVEGSFDMILSNPPYIRTSEIERLQEEVRFHDPIKALDGKRTVLFYSDHRERKQTVFKARRMAYI